MRVLPALFLLPPITAFVLQSNPGTLESSLGFRLRAQRKRSVDDVDIETIRLRRKEDLKSLLGISKKGTVSVSNRSDVFDSVLACPIDKQPLKIVLDSDEFESSSSLIASFDVIDANNNNKVQRKRGRKVLLLTESGCHKYAGRTDGFYDLLADSSSNSNADSEKSSSDKFVETMRVFVPPPLRSYLLPNNDKEYIPMRDLFTSPAVSFAYERGWRQGFAAAGFPGADTEYEMVRDYFAPAVASANNVTVVVDMSCATGLFTRRLAQSGNYDRVIGCDYSESMLNEARSRINRMDMNSESQSSTKLELVRLDVAQIPMQDESIDALHAGAAMHCWPDVQAGLNEIHRVLKPGGRYFASTFLSTYFRTLQATETDIAKQMQAFQYFESTDKLKEMVINAGFDKDKVTVDLLGNACIIIKAEK